MMENQLSPSVNGNNFLPPTPLQAQYQSQQRLTPPTTLTSSKPRKYSIVDLPATCNWKDCLWQVEGSTESMVYRHSLETHCVSGKQVCMWQSHPNRPFELCETTLRNKVTTDLGIDQHVISAHGLPNRTVLICLSLYLP